MQNSIEKQKSTAQEVQETVVLVSQQLHKQKSLAGCQRYPQHEELTITLVGSEIVLNFCKNKLDKHKN